MFDPSLPAANTQASSAIMRAQLQGLFALIQAVPAGPQGVPGPPFAQAIVDGVTTLPPGSAATVTVSFDGVNVHLSFGIPQGVNGTTGAVLNPVIDSVTTLAPGSAATVSVVNDGFNARYIFGIPRGQDGAMGNTGPVANPLIDSVTTLPTGQPATASVSFDGTNARFSFGIPAGPQGMTGPPADLSGTSNNSNGVATLGLMVSDPPTQAQVQALASKLDELILALRR